MKIRRVETLVIMVSVNIDGDEIEEMINETEDLTVVSWKPLSTGPGFEFVVNRALHWYPDTIK